jgi:predicted transcriptional regulator
MSAIIIRADNQGNKILSELAKKLGADVLTLNDQQFDDIALGTLMENQKTGQTVTREEIFRKLKKS